MKAQTKVCSPMVSLGFQASEHFKISKSRDSDAEMQACFTKLKDLVPTVPHDRKLSKVQLLQHVIDYILDLEVTLDFKPTEVSQLLLPATAEVSERRPLSECSALNTTPSQTRTLSEDSEMKDDTRPASC